MTSQVPESLHAVLDRPLTVRPVAGRVGAEICPVRLSGDLPEDVVARLRGELHRHKVLFFRGQHHLDEAGLLAFARRLGDPGRVPSSGQDGGAWHTDASYTERPPRATLLQAVELPSRGGDTVWANTAAAYDALPVELRDLADRLWAHHADPSGRADHPVVRLHPETGERSLLLGGFARSIVGLSAEADSEALIRLFQDHVTRLENTVRWRWEAGDVALADNRSTQYRVVRDFGDEPRHLRRVTLAGEVPVPVVRRG
ncbi:TauD/TfdA dioxygenase family protein [Actinomadura flavalba]|uniref:TauD/TfdA dioxygenase family protein n=1 Tax=Actinomadura flavalba TaxID=1120938 RepID=UPI00052618C5|nr:TauD/TfdA family dioxygenase [Actinomadura flavalba]